MRTDIGSTWVGTVIDSDGRTFTVTDPKWLDTPTVGARVEVTVTYLSPYLSLVEAKS